MPKNINVLFSITRFQLHSITTISLLYDIKNFAHKFNDDMEYDVIRGEDNTGYTNSSDPINLFHIKEFVLCLMAQINIDINSILSGWVTTIEFKGLREDPSNSKRGHQRF